MKERLQKIIASRGIASRREAEKLILAGKVSVNGEIVRELGAKADPDADELKIGGRKLPGRQPPHALAFHKPVGYLCTRSPSRESGPTIYELLPQDRRYVSVGRLDRDSSGLLIITDDGALAHRLTHPRFGTRKVYRVVTTRVLDNDQLARLRRGVRLEDGWARANEINHVRGAELEIILTEGRNRQIRRMIEAVGAEVSKLHRTAIGNLQLGRLKPGQSRLLSAREIEALKMEEAAAPKQAGDSHVSRG